MDVSIVIVSYNTRRLLDECIQSIKQKTSVTFEIIVVDNASADDSCEMVRTKHPDVRLIENLGNAGFARANNKGFAIARGRYFFMLNPDTVILDHAIDKLVKFLDENPDVGICGPRNIGPEGALQHSCDHFPSLWNTLCYYIGLGKLFESSAIFNRCWMSYWNYDHIKDVDRMVGCSLLIRATLYQELGGLDENYFMYYEETDLCYRARKLGSRITYLPDACIIHYGGESSRDMRDEMTTFIMPLHYSSKYYYYKKNYGLASMYCIRILDFLNATLVLLRNSIRIDKKRRQNGLKQGAHMMRMSFSALNKGNNK